MQFSVNHQVKSKPEKVTFQRAAIFVNENFIVYSANNTSKVFETDEYYTAGEDQLEVYLNGIRLNIKQDFVEMKDQNNECTADELKKKKTETRYFKITNNVTIKPNDKITYKISKYVWNYDQLSLLMGTTLDDINALNIKVNKNINDIKALNNSLVNAINNLEKKIADTRAMIPDKTQFTKNTDILSIDRMDNSIKDKLIDNAVTTFEMNTTVLQPLTSISVDDFIQVFYISPNESRILVKGSDYNIVNNSGNTSIELSPILINRNASLYVNAIKIGVD